MAYATQDNPHGRFCEGTVIKVSGASVKADNGTFRLESPFPAQPSGGAYLQWKRMKRNGETCEANTARNLRGGRASKLEGWIEKGICEVVSEPTPESPTTSTVVDHCQGCGKVAKVTREAFAAHLCEDCQPKSAPEPTEPTESKPEPGSMADLFGPVIYAYTRAQALADGELVDISKLASEAGITFPVAVTRAVYALLDPARMPCGQSVDGRGWDLVWMLRCTIKAGAAGSLIKFQVIFGEEGPRGGYTQKLTNLKAVCGPGDDAEPVITVMLPEED